MFSRAWYSAHWMWKAVRSRRAGTSTHRAERCVYCEQVISPQPSMKVDLRQLPECPGERVLPLLFGESSDRF